MDNYMDIINILIEKKEAKKSFDVLKNVFHLCLDDLFDENKE